MVAERTSKPQNKTVCRGVGPGTLKGYVVQRRVDVWVTGGVVPLLLCVHTR